MSNVYKSSDSPPSLISSVELQYCYAPVWVNANIDGTSDVSYNVSSLTDVATGKIGVNCSVTFTDTNYVGICTPQFGSNSWIDASKMTANLSTTRTDFACGNISATVIDPVEWNILLLGNVIS